MVQKSRPRKLKKNYLEWIKLRANETGQKMVFLLRE
jgi:hypothetical protein